jgi:hypothetical protein
MFTTNRIARRKHVVAIVLGLALACCAPSVVQAATFNIANGDAAGLIAAIQTANSNGDASNTINLARNGTYVLTAVAENPPEYNAPGPVGLPVIRRDVTINGNGATIQRSTAPGTPPFVLLAVSGRTASCGNADCLTYPSLTLNQTILTGGVGGLHMNAATALVQASTVTQNIDGGGISNACGTLTLVNSTVSYNTSNNAYGGGGIFLWGFSCAPGKPVVNISFSTIFENSNTGWGRGNSIGSAFVDPAGGVFLKNSILASPSYPSEVVCNISTGTLHSLGHNILGDAADIFGSSCPAAFTAPGDMISTNPLLGPTAENGGPTPTSLPLFNSPALDAVPLSYCSDVAGVPVTTDQRGAARSQGPACDIGSVEAYAGDDDSAYARLAGANTFTGNQTVNGTLSATTFVGDGSALTGVGKIMSVTPGSGLTGGGSSGNISLAVDSTVARTNASNTFTADQTVNAGLAANSLTTSGTVTIGSGTPITRHLSMQAQVGFAALKSGACATVAVPIVGVGDGDTVVLTVPNSFMQAAGTPSYTAWVGVGDAIAIRACNLNPNTPQKSGVIGPVRLDIWKH